MSTSVRYTHIRQEARDDDDDDVHDVVTTPSAEVDNDDSDNDSDNDGFLHNDNDPELRMRIMKQYRRNDAVRTICATILMLFLVSKLSALWQQSQTESQLSQSHSLPANVNLTVHLPCPDGNSVYLTTTTTTTTTSSKINVTTTTMCNKDVDVEDEQEKEVEEISNDHDTDTILQEVALKTPLPLPLQPPYRIVQMGVPRSGSTFQFYVLDAIAQLKTKTQSAGAGAYKINSRYVGMRFSTQYQHAGVSYVLKTHDVHHHNDNFTDLEALQHNGRFVIFTSGLTTNDDDQNQALYRLSLYNQDKDRLDKCPLCEVDQYKEIFGLNDTEVDIVKDYMNMFSILRQCCGLQMSKYEVARLNGCDITSNGIMDRPDYPHCELVDKAAMEEAISSSPIHYKEGEPGDCAKYDAIIANGTGFNGKPYNPETDCPV